MAGRPQGYAKTGGRKKGSVNKKREAQVRAEEMGILPLDYMLMATKRLWEEGDINAAGDMASKAAPYIHRKMPQAIETKDTTEQTLEDIINGRELEAANARADQAEAQLNKFRANKF